LSENGKDEDRRVRRRCADPERGDQPNVGGLSRRHRHNAEVGIIVEPEVVDLGLLADAPPQRPDAGGGVGPAAEVDEHPIAVGRAALDRGGQDLGQFVVDGDRPGPPRLGPPPGQVDHALLEVDLGL